MQPAEQVQSARAPRALDDLPVAVAGAAGLVSRTQAIEFERVATAAAAWSLKRYGWRVRMVSRVPLPFRATSTSTAHLAAAAAVPPLCWCCKCAARGPAS